MTQLNPQDSIQHSYPPPPPWYKDFTSPEDIQNCQPPPLPERTYTCFGWPRIAVQSEKRGIASLPQLDSDTKLYSNVQDLKGEFQRLFQDLIQAMMKFLDQLSQTGRSLSGSVGSSIRTIMKIHKNLQHILVLLRYWEAHEEVVLHFKRQLKSRKQLIEALRYCVSPDSNENHESPDTKTEETEQHCSDENHVMDSVIFGGLSVLPEESHVMTAVGRSSESSLLFANVAAPAFDSFLSESTFDPVDLEMKRE